MVKTSRLADRGYGDGWPTEDVDETSSTTYQQATSSTSANAITAGERVLALGTTNGTTITATQVSVQPTGGGSTSSSGRR